MTRKLVSIIGLIALAALMTLGIFHETRRADAQEVSPPNPELISFGMVGITPGQTVRLSVANTTAPSDNNFPPGPSRVVLTFLDSAGQYMRHRNGSIIRRAAQLERAQSTFLDLNGDDIQWPDPIPWRLQLRAVVNVYPPGPIDIENPPPVNDRIVPSVEIFNNANGRTVVFIGNPGVIRGFNPQPDPPAPE